MELLTSLGINSTALSQLVVFIFVYFILSRVVFRPYLRAFLKREESTVGSEENAEKLLQEASELSEKLQEKSKKISLEQMSIYNEVRQEAQKDFDRLVGEARVEADKELEGLRSVIKSDVNKVRENMSTEASSVSEGIVGKLIGKSL